MREIDKNLGPANTQGTPSEGITIASAEDVKSAFDPSNEHNPAGLAATMLKASDSYYGGDTPHHTISDDQPSIPGTTSNHPRDL